MNRIIDDLSAIGCDMDKALERFFFDEEMLVNYLKKFINDKTFNNLTAMIREKKSDEAFKHAHAIKGLAGNLELKRLYFAMSELVESLRNNKLFFIEEQFNEACNAYYEVVSIVKD